MSIFLLIIYLIIDLTIIVLVYFYMKKIGYLFLSIGNIFYKKFIPFTTFTCIYFIGYIQRIHCLELKIRKHFLKLLIQCSLVPFVMNHVTNIT